MSLILYGDFTDADCYLAARRASALARAGTEVDFRGVEAHPRTPIAGARLSAADQDLLTARFGELTALLRPGEVLPWSLPAMRPRSEAAVAAYAQAHGTRVDTDVLQVLFELYWRDGVDIGSPNDLRAPLAGAFLRSGSPVDPVRRFGYAVTVDRGPITDEAYRRIRAWRAEWRELGGAPLPVLLDGGATLHGTDALTRLAKRLDHLDTPEQPGAPARTDPRRYPALGVRPSPAWTSQVGGLWSTAYRDEAAGVGSRS